MTAKHCADLLDTVAADLGVGRHELLVVNCGASALEALADHVGLDALHEVAEKRNRCVGEEVTTVFSRVGDNLVHLVELLAADSVSDEWRFVQRLVVRGLSLDASIGHGFEGELNTGANEGDHEDALVEVLLLGDFNVARSGLFESGRVGRFAPCEQILVVIVPVGHHAAGERAGHDVFLMLVEQVAHDVLQLLGELECLELSWVAEAIHHVGDAAVLERFANRVEGVLHELGRPTCFDALFDHLVVSEQRTGLEKTAENCLLAHEVGLNFSDEAGLETAGAVAASGASVGLGNVPTLAFRVVFSVNSEKRRNAETALVLFADLRAWALRSNHDYSEVLADFHAFFHDVETVRVSEGRALLHEWLYRIDYGGVLLVGSEVEHEVSGWEHLFVSADSETVLGRVLPRLALFFDRCPAESVADVETGVPHVEALIEPLSATANDDHFLALECFDSVKLGGIHETATAELLELLGQSQCVEVVFSAHGERGLKLGKHALCCPLPSGKAIFRPLASE